MTTQTITYRFSLDIFKNGVQRILQGFQTGEAVARKMEITLVAGADSFELPTSGITAVMYVKRPSQEEPSINACEIDYVNNKIKYDIPTIDEQEAGIVSMQLKLIDTTGTDERVIVSPKFAFEVWESEISDSEAETTPQYTALTLALAKAEKVAHSAITEFIIDDTNLLIVTFADGSQYTSTVIQDALENISNVEAWAERAETAMTSAENSANTALSAEASAVSASTLAVNASNTASLAASNALTSERNASDSEANAYASEANARASASSASASETMAYSYKVNASISANNASTAEVNASASARSASTSEANASASATSADSNAKLSQSYAVGGVNIRPNESNDNAKYYKEQCEQIASALQGGFIPMGTVTFANLPTNASAGWMYNVSDEFVSDSRFKDGGGKTYASGTNVYLTSDNMWDCLSGSIPTVNGKVGNSITLDGRDLLLDGYSKATADSAIAVTDNITTAFGKLEKKADEVDTKIQNAVTNLGEVLTYKGTVATYADLPTNAQPGWVYHVADEGTNYAYEVEPGASTGTWSEMGQHIDLSEYVHYSDIVDNLESTDISKALSANQGNVLSTEITSVESKASFSNTELSLLGWNVPSGITNLNVINADGKFEQHMERLDLGIVRWTNKNASQVGRYDINSSDYGLFNKANGISNVYLEGYITCTTNTMPNKSIRGGASNGEMAIVDEAYNGYSNAEFQEAMKGKYAYYELATPKIYSIDGHEESHRIDDLEYIGWSVPRECPIQNAENPSGGRRKRVNRVHIPDLNWVYETAVTPHYFYCVIPSGCKNNGNVYCSKLPNKSFGVDNSIYITNNTILIARYDSSTSIEGFKSAMQGVYLYYELATEEVITKGNPIRLDYSKAIDLKTSHRTNTSKFTVPQDGAIEFSIDSIVSYSGADTYTIISRKYALGSFTIGGIRNVNVGGLSSGQVFVNKGDVMETLTNTTESQHRMLLYSFIPFS